MITSIWCYGNASRNRIQKNGIFFRHFLFFQKLSEIPQNLFLEEFPFFYLFPWFLGQIPVQTGLIFLRDFPIIWFCFPFFLVCFRFSKKVLNSLFVDWFPFFWVQFLILESVSGFQKSFKFSVYWSVSSVLDQFPLFLGPFLVFKKSFKFSIVDWFPRILGPIPHFLGPFPVFKKSFKFSVW